MSGIQEFCRRFRAWHSTIAVMLVAAGCSGAGVSPFSGPRYQVKGKVVLADGKPLTSGRIFFRANEPPTIAAADIGSDGSFEFKGPSGDGLPEAKYTVRITPPAAPKEQKRPSSQRTPPNIRTTKTLG